MLVPLIKATAQSDVDVQLTLQWFAAPAACAACVFVAADTPAHADVMYCPGATMSGLKRESNVGPLLEKSAKLFADGLAADCDDDRTHAVLQQAAHRPAAWAASQQSFLVQVGGFLLQQAGGACISSQKLLGLTYMQKM